MTASRILLDSSAWIEYLFVGKGKIKEIVESQRFVLLTSAISVLEIKRKLLAERYSAAKINEVLEFMRNNSIIKAITEEVCEKAAEDCIKLGFHAADAIIYRTAKENNARLITLDSDFKEVPDTIVIGRKSR